MGIISPLIEIGLKYLPKVSGHKSPLSKNVPLISGLPKAEVFGQRFILNFGLHFFDCELAPVLGTYMLLLLVVRLSLIINFTSNNVIMQ